MTHSMRKSTGETGDVYTVGIWTGSGWNSVKDFDDGEDAAAFCNYLNGGDGKAFKPPSTIEQSAPLPVPELAPIEPIEADPDHPEPEDDFEDTPRPSISAVRKKPKHR